MSLLSNRKAKIVCTIGPSSADREMIFSLIKNGMDVARLNFSHGDYTTHKKAIKFIRDGSRRYNRPVAILQDLQGIKIRVGLIEGGAAELKKGRTVLLIPGEDIGNKEEIFIPSFTEKDERDLLFGIDMGVDYVAISFVRDAGDIRTVKRWLKDKGQQIPLIAKIEKPEA